MGGTTSLGKEISVSEQIQFKTQKGRSGKGKFYFCK